MQICLIILRQQSSRYYQIRQPRIKPHLWYKHQTLNKNIGLVFFSEHCHKMFLQLFQILLYVCLVAMVIQETVGQRRDDMFSWRDDMACKK